MEVDPTFGLFDNDSPRWAEHYPLKSQSVSGFGGSVSGEQQQLGSVSFRLLLLFLDQHLSVRQRRDKSPAGAETGTGGELPGG